MANKRLLQPIQAKPIILRAEQVDIEVPIGESCYLIQQNETDPAEQHYIFHLRQPGTRVRISGVIIASRESTPHLQTEVIHHAPETQMETLIRTVVFDQAAPHYDGLIRIEKQAQHCESYLNHHSLLIGKETKSWSRPALEIEAEQVKCSHAATIRTLTELDLFYLRCRGIGEEEARGVLIKAFLEDR